MQTLPAYNPVDVEFFRFYDHRFLAVANYKGLDGNGDESYETESTIYWWEGENKLVKIFETSQFMKSMPRLVCNFDCCIGVTQPALKLGSTIDIFISQKKERNKICDKSK